MNVRELIDYLAEQDPDAEVELALIAPVGEEDEDITVDRYSVEALYPHMEPDDDGDDEAVVWLLCGEQGDIEAFIDAVDPESLEGLDESWR